MERVEPEGYWCDICHQKHYQINPACFEERRRRITGEGNKRISDVRRILENLQRERGQGSGAAARARVTGTAP